jgi:hypothetical protein
MLGSVQVERDSKGPVAPMPVKYYLYISDEKVEMLAGQLKRGAGEVLSSWNVNVGPVGGGATLRPVPAARYKQLEKIRRHVLTREDCGTIDDPGAYVIDSLPVRWGPFGADSAITFFTGATARTVFALGGSTASLVQPPPREGGGAYPRGGSATDILISTLLHAFGRTDHPNYDPTAAEYPGALCDAVTGLAADYARPYYPEAEVEFLAKRLVVGEQQRSYRFEVDAAFETPETVFLGSPLYVAMSS